MGMLRAGPGATRRPEGQGSSVRSSGAFISVIHFLYRQPLCKSFVARISALAASRFGFFFFFLKVILICRGFKIFGLKLFIPLR